MLSIIQEQLIIKRSGIKSKLKSTADKKIGKGQMVIVCAELGKNLNLSGQTVYNYIRGEIKDGYLAEAILKELRLYKPIKQTS